MLLNSMSRAFFERAFLSIPLRVLMSKLIGFESILGYFYFFAKAGFSRPSTELDAKLFFWIGFILMISPVKS
jgi:hypothetical protein